jgi:methyl-accepting chemotaxis protein
MDAMNQTTSDLRRAQLTVTLVSLALILFALVFLGDLNDYLVSIAIVVAVLLFPMFLVHQLFSLRLLRPVERLLKQVNDESPPPDQLIREAEDALTAFQRKESTFAVVLWLVGGVLAWAVMNFYVGITPWQVLVLVCLVLCGAITNILLAGYVTAFGLRSARKAVESVTLGAQLGTIASRRLSRSILTAFTGILVIAIGLSSLIWFSRTRASIASSVLSDRRPGFHLVAAGMDAALTEKPDKGLREVLRESDPTGSFSNSVAILDGRGKLMVKPPSMNLDPVWFERILSAQSEQWSSLRAPFLYMTKRLSTGHVLIFVAPMALVYEEAGSTGLYGVAGASLILIIGLLLAWSVTRTCLRSLMDIGDRFHDLAEGELNSVAVRGGDGELAELVRAIAGFAQKFHLVLGTSIDKSKGLSREQTILFKRVNQFKESAEQRIDVADQTATSVVEMRSAIQSISEQMDSLREASSDCTSAMFEIDQSVREVALSAENLQKLVEDTASAMTQITVSMEQVVNNVDDLARTADETVNSIAVIDGSIKQVEESTTQTHRVSEEVSELASRGASSVSQTIDGINEIQQITDEAQEIINRLGTQMEAVGKILTVIGDVAEQTNLLALNAAIIAAAAGEHGKGFAVVADEIKDLADRTSTSTKEIAGLIRSVQSESRLAIDAMQRGSGSVRRGVELANNAGEALKQILSSVRQVTEMSNDIATSTTEHSSITRTITKSMTDMTTMVREIKRAVAEQSKGGSRVNRASEQMRDDARFVFRSANEQVQAAAGVSRNMERISEMVSFVSKAMVEQSNGVNHVARVAEEVRDTLEQERAQIADLEEVADRIGRQATEFIGFLDSHNQPRDEKR